MNDTAQYVLLLAGLGRPDVPGRAAAGRGGRAVPAGGLPGRQGHPLGEPAAVGAVPPGHARRAGDHLGDRRSTPADAAADVRRASSGVVLVILGIAYGISMLVLIRVRERRRADQISEQVYERLADRGVVAAHADAGDPEPGPADPARSPRSPSRRQPVAPPAAHAALAQALAARVEAAPRRRHAPRVEHDRPRSERSIGCSTAAAALLRPGPAHRAREPKTLPHTLRSPERDGLMPPCRPVGAGAGGLHAHPAAASLMPLIAAIEVWADGPHGRRSTPPAGPATHAGCDRRRVLSPSRDELRRAGCSRGSPSSSVRPAYLRTPRPARHYPPTSASTTSSEAASAVLGRRPLQRSHAEAAAAHRSTTAPPSPAPAITGTGTGSRCTVRFQ